MTCALASSPFEDGPFTRAYLRETEGGTFVSHDSLLLLTWEALARIRARRVGNTNRRVAPSSLLWQDAPERPVRDGYAIPRCVFCGAKQHTGAECPNDALDYDDREVSRREVEP